MKQKIFWADISGYVGIYEISTTGNVRSLKRIVVYKNGWRKTHRGVLLKPGICSNGYYSVRLSKNGVTKTQFNHKLVAKAFISNPLSKKTVNHKDGNKLNNNIDNLEWNTYSENNKNAYLTGLKRITAETKKKISSSRLGPKNPMAKLSESDVLEIKALLSLNMRQYNIADKFNVHDSLISKIKNNKIWKGVNYQTV